MNQDRTLTSVSTNDGLTSLRVYVGERVIASLVFLDSEEGALAVQRLTAALSPKPKARRKTRAASNAETKLRLVGA